jgi:LPXTG-site transpeptidase (sortase) family protein
MIGSGVNLQWGTYALLANKNRRDLVGQLPTSVNPGDGSNIVLVGHNYNRGDSNWYGVFINLKALTPGDRITVYTQNDREFHYTVQEVRQVPWSQEEGGGLGEHQEYLWPTPHEQLTLVTCGGVNLLRWSDRIYVVALPVVD